MTAKPPYITAMVGTGHIASTAHMRAIHANADRITLAAGMDSDPERLAQFCTANHVPGRYADLGKMLEEVRPDLVIMTAPPTTHRQYIQRCLEAGAWVFCEKPITMSLADLDALLEIECRTQAHFASILQNRFGAGTTHLRNLIAQGALGEPMLVLSQTLWFRTQDYYDVPWRGRWDNESGGTAMMHGVHQVDQVFHLLGDWAEVRAMISTRDRAIEVENLAMGMVRLASGVQMSFVSSALSPRQETYMRIDFQRATVELRHLYSYTNADWTYSFPQEPDNPELAALARIPDETPGSHGTQLGLCLDCMARGERPPVGGAELRRTVEFMAAFYKSAFTGQAVRPGEIGPGDPFYTAMNGQGTTVGTRG